MGRRDERAEVGLAPSATGRLFVFHGESPGNATGRRRRPGTLLRPHPHRVGSFLRPRPDVSALYARAAVGLVVYPAIEAWLWSIEHRAGPVSMGDRGQPGAVYRTPAAYLGQGDLLGNPKAGQRV